MALTSCAVIFDPITKIVQMIVVPDDDSQLTDPAFNPPGLTQQLVPIAIYQQQGMAGLVAAVPGLVPLAPVPIPAANPNPPNPHFVPPVAVTPT